MKEGAMKNFVEWLVENFSDDEIKTANKTSRAAGAVSAKAIVPRHVEHSEEKDHPGEKGKRKILDFGAGHKAVHAAALRAKGHDVTAHEFGANQQKGVHDPDALKKKHHKAYASNVLNVQSGHKMMHHTLSQVRHALHKDGEFVANYPDSPRKSNLSHEDVEKHLKNHFHNVKRVKSVPGEGGKESKISNKAPLFHCSHPKEDHEVKEPAE